MSMLSLVRMRFYKAVRGGTAFWFDAIHNLKIYLVMLIYFFVLCLPNYYCFDIFLLYYLTLRTIEQCFSDDPPAWYLDTTGRSRGNLILRSRLPHKCIIQSWLASVAQEVTDILDSTPISRLICVIVADRHPKAPRL